MCNTHILREANTVSIKNVQKAHISAQLRDLHGSLVEIVGVMNRPQRDEAMVREAGISLDRALFPLLVLVERLGPIGVVELADRVGRGKNLGADEQQRQRTATIIASGTASRGRSARR